MPKYSNPRRRQSIGLVVASLGLVLGFQNCGSFSTSGLQSLKEVTVDHLGQSARVSSVEVNQMTPALHGGSLYNIYAPSILGSQVWVGGWATSAEIGPDRLYQ